MIKVISQRWDWVCGDGCCSESKHTLTFLIKDSDDGTWSSFYFEDVICNAPETIEELINSYQKDCFEHKMLSMAAMSGQLEFEVVEEEFVEY